jgi:hypothetical protein
MIMKKHLLLFALLAFLCGQFLSAQTHHWPLTTDLNDVVGSLNGTNNGVTFGNDAVRGPVCILNGAGYANLPSFVFGLTEISIACWYRMDSSKVWSRIYSFGKGDQTDPKDVLMLIPVSGNNNMYRFTLKPEGDQWYDIDFPVDVVNIQLNTWYFTGIVLKPDSIIIYHDGNQIFAESGYPNAFGTINDTENALGKSFWADPMFIGALSDLRVYNTALSAAEMKALYDATKVTTDVDDIVSAGDEPLIYSRLNRIVIQINKPVTDEIVSVYSVTGELLAAKPIHEINQVSFKTGIYIVRVEGSNTNHATKVFVN